MVPFELLKGSWWPNAVVLTSCSSCDVPKGPVRKISISRARSIRRHTKRQSLIGHVIKVVITEGSAVILFT